MALKRICTYCLILGLSISCSRLAAQVSALSTRMAATLMAQHSDSLCYDKSKPDKWNYELGVLLVAIEQVWRQTGDGQYFRYIQKLIDNYIGEEGTIRTYNRSDYNIDMLPPGRACLLLYEQTGKVKYKKAAEALFQQLADHPRTAAGGFWHKKRYPQQMWLDGLYMGAPFYAAFSHNFNQNNNFDDIAHQLILMEKNALDSRTGLLYHAHDAVKEQAWADKTTGHSPHFWGRAMGWYAMALVDVLDYLPPTHPKRKDIEAILKRTAAAVLSVQDPSSGVWYQVLDKGKEAGNYLEASASAMFTYAFLKGARLGVLDKKYVKAAQKAYAGMLKQFVTTDAAGQIHLEHTCSVAGLGGNPYRDGSFKYYISEPQRTDDVKGAGPFIMASVELERLTQYPPIGKGKTVVLDYFFNNEYRKNSAGTTERFHYTWEDVTNSGFAWWGAVFRAFGAHTQALETAPTLSNLANASVYIIVDPDTEKETAQPHFITSEHTTILTQWVKKGGILVLMANDTANCEIPHFNQLAGAFGIQFTNNSRNMVKNNVFEQGAVNVPSGHLIFKTAQRLFIKELSVLQVQPPATLSLSAEGAGIMATARYGKGWVFAIGDPWLYNEYVDGKKLPATFDNFKAMRDLSLWLLSKAYKR